jgi:hypothetical protein
MAVVHKLTDGDTTVDLTNTADSYDITYNLLREGYVPQVAVPPGDGSIPPYVTETLPVRIAAPSADYLARALHSIHRLHSRAATYHADERQTTEVYYRHKLDDETSERAVLVREIAAIPRWSHLSSPAPEDYVVDLVISRHPYWESYDAITLGPAQVSSVGGTVGFWQPMSNIYGDVPARISRLDLEGISGGGGPLYTFWIGARPENKYGDTNSFVPVWECEDGTNLSGGDCVDSSDSTASGGSRVTCDFASETGWTDRMRLRVMDTAGGNPYFLQAGTFLMLLRCKVDGSTVVYVRPKTSLTLGDDAFLAVQPAIQVTSTSWELREFGILRMPPEESTSGGSHGNISEAGVVIQATQSSGGSLYLDCIILIPVDEGFIKVDGGLVEYSGGDRRRLRITTLPDDRVVAYAYHSGNRRRACPTTAVNWGLPVGMRSPTFPIEGKVILVFAAQRDGSSTVTDSFQVNCQWYTRWLSLLGSTYVG